jgi:hypothetical protein
MSNQAEQSQTREIGVSEAATRMAALLGGDEPKPNAQPEPAPAEALEAEATADEVDETPVLEDGLAAQATDDTEETDSGADEDGNTVENLSPETLVTVKIDGKTQEIPLKEALEGYQRQSDYSRRMNELRQEKVSFEQEYEAVRTERQQYATLIDALDAQLKELVPQEPDWERLHKEDPLNFPLVEKQWRDYQARLAATKAEKERLSYLQQKEEQDRLKTIVEQGRQYLVKQVPEWNDPNKWNEARAALKEYGQKVGYSEDELAQAYDPRAILVLEKARKYDALMANRPKPDKKEGPKPLRSGTPASAPKQQTEVARAKMRLSKTGSVDDAAKLFGLMESRRR